jgi:hypothetical protein
MAVAHVVQDTSQGGAVVVAVADTHTDPGGDFADERVAPVVGREEAPGSSSAPSPGSTCPELDRVVEGG